MIAPLLLATAAGAAPKVRGGEEGALTFEDSRPGDVVRTPPPPEAEPASVGTGTKLSRPRKQWYRYDRLVWDPATASFCVDPQWTTDQAYAQRQGRVDFPGRFDSFDTGRVRATCPDPATPAATANTTNGPPPQAPATAAQLAADAWQHVENLPKPTQTMQPNGFAITGKKAYLQIHGPQTWTRTIDNPIGDDVVITATSDYVVDWGDPTATADDPAQATTTTTSQGGPYPDGDVTHVYVDKSPKVTITVTQRWHATWQAGNRTGTLASLETRAEPPLTIEVRDLQAVRQR